LPKLFFVLLTLKLRRGVHKEQSCGMNLKPNKLNKWEYFSILKLFCSNMRQKTTSFISAQSLFSLFVLFIDSLHLVLETQTIFCAICVYVITLDLCKQRIARSFCSTKTLAFSAFHFVQTVCLQRGSSFATPSLPNTIIVVVPHRFLLLRLGFVGCVAPYLEHHFVPKSAFVRGKRSPIDWLRGNNLRQLLKDRQSQV